MSYGHISQRRRTFGPTADFVLSQAHLLPYRRRYVLRRLRPLCGHKPARRGGSIEFQTLEQLPQFISLTFLGLTIGSFVTGFIGDRYGRRFTYQFNLMIFGLASLAAAFAPDMMTLNILRFVMGLGLGAEIVVGYSTMTEF